MSTIPASQLVNVVPSVLGAGGSGVDVVGLCLTDSTRAPIGSVLSFADAASVEDYFGAGSTEARIAGGGANQGAGYFGGFVGATKLPATLLIAQYNPSAVSAYARGGDVSALTLAQLQAINGSLTIAVDGISRPAASVDLAAATSFSSAAGIIQTALNAATPAGASITASIATNVLTVTAVGSGTIAPGQLVSGAGVDPGIWIVSQLTGTPGGTGTYSLSASDTVSSEAMTTKGADVVVTYDSISGAFVVTSGITGALSTIAFATGTIADDLKLQSAQGAVLSQGAAAASPAAFMNNLLVVNRNWVTFFTSFDPDGGIGNTVKQAFAAWKNSQNDQFAYICWDTDITPTNSLPASASLGQILAANGDSGTCLIYEPSDQNLAAFVAGAAASIDFTATNGRISFAFKSQEGLVASVTDPTVATNLAGNPQTAGSFGNGYNFYGAYGTASNNFIWFQRSLVTGSFRWLDSYINQVWLNSTFQAALLTLLQNAKSVPYSVEGRGMIEAALADPIQAGLNFGAFGPGELSQSQRATVNADAGKNVADTLATQGWYLQVLPATAAVRAARTTPPCKFWYIDRGSVQAINLASVALQ